MANITNINIINWNANGLRYKLAELIYFAQIHDIHVISITETRLRPDIKINIPNYAVFRADGNSDQRGVLLAVKNDLNPQQISLPQNLKILEAVGASIHTSKGKVMFVSAYNSPASSKPLDVGSLGEIFRLETRVVISGDLNSRHSQWGCRTTNKNGRKLLNFTLQNNIELIYPSEPTRFPTTQRVSPSVLDLTLTKGLTNASTNCISCNALSSDHNPVKCQLKLQTTSNPITQFDIGRANWSKFRQILNEKIEIPTAIDSTTKLDHTVESLTNTIINAASASIPKKKVEFKIDKLPNHLRELIQTKNKVRKEWHKNRDPVSRGKWNKLCKEVKCEIAQWRQQIWKDRISKLTTQDNSIWQFVRKLKGKKAAIGPFTTSQGFEHCPLKKANLLADNYEKQFINQNQSPFEQEIIDELQNENSRSPQISISIKPKHVIKAIKRVKLNKAPGYDGILPVFVKSLPGKVYVLLARIYQSIFDLEYFPSIWKNAEIVPVLKPGKSSSQPINYRPISLLPILGKISEQFILEWLEREANERKIIPNWQFGFRKNHSALQQVYRVVTYIKTNKPKPTAMVMLDIAKAFDSVWHSGLLVKLKRFGIPTQLCRIIKSFLENRQFRVRVDNIKSNWRPIRAGTPQGALLSPLLYSLYIADIPPPQNGELAQFADDTAVYYSHWNIICLVRRMRKELEKLTKYFQDWKLGLNKEKTEALIFTNKKKHLFWKIKYQDFTLNWAQTARYLGVILDRKLKWRPHIKHSSERGRLVAKAIWQLTGRRSALAPEQKVNLYKSLIRSRLTYGSQIWWGQTAKSNVALIERTENKTLRVIANPPPGINNYIIRTGLGIESISEHIDQLYKKFESRIRVHENPTLEPRSEFN